MPQGLTAGPDVAIALGALAASASGAVTSIATWRTWVVQGPLAAGAVAS